MECIPKTETLNFTIFLQGSVDGGRLQGADHLHIFFFDGRPAGFPQDLAVTNWEYGESGDGTQGHYTFHGI